ncbi:glutamine-hydrolyzing carbamoyl-phosphate synthase small subunit [Rubrivirga litoralis]|uniref:Carbamoyl phosphate synthase small chain n=1 Tax=Rubrivirga litoralis TaxID=3075598 RepID=A0ABU3BUE4_9BACT|nr:glutamine-hydrolyzing carbamoyl-phosphate synthase small subunit [Rubrivirga sp. F394]MDT0632911.1 glutamine-hydrolyzing carbamoyl-phosphate synthase small subunit [Rubrivirga sp. F394]
MPETPDRPAGAPPAPAKLALEDGTVVTGTAVGAPGETTGELCFNTSMSGYQEILTDPSYAGQLMMMTYPHIGNYGAFEAATEADRPHVAGLVVREFSRHPSNSRMEETLDAYMARHGLVGISGVDTRRLVRHIRERGVMNAVVSSVDLDDDSLVAKAKAAPSMEGLELASGVSTDAPYDVPAESGPHAGQPHAGAASNGRGGAGRPRRVAVYDYGVKRHILRSFAGLGCDVRVFPAGTPLADVMAWEPDGVFLSNGPGDPRAMPEAVETARGVIATGTPVFGICLGHQLLALAEGLEVFKMKVGHRGANHPVLNLETGRVEISTQNHGFAVRDAGLDGVAEVDHRNLNDDTVEGLRFLRFPGFSVQYHPEACPGPHDSRYLFEQFVRLMDGKPLDEPAVPVPSAAPTEAPADAG